MKALFPALNSPTITSRNRSSSWRIDAASAAWSSLGGAELGQRVAQGREQLAGAAKLSFGAGIENAQHA